MNTVGKVRELVDDMLLKRKQCIARLNWTSRSLVGAVSVRHGFKTFVPLLQSTEEISQTKPFPPRLADAVQIFKNSSKSSLLSGAFDTKA